MSGSNIRPWISNPVIEVTINMPKAANDASISVIRTRFCAIKLQIPMGESLKNRINMNLDVQTWISSHCVSVSLLKGFQELVFSKYNLCSSLFSCLCGNATPCLNNTMLLSKYYPCRFALISNTFAGKNAELYQVSFGKCNKV